MGVRGCFAIGSFVIGHVSPPEFTQSDATKLLSSHMVIVYSIRCLGLHGWQKVPLVGTAFREGFPSMLRPKSFINHGALGMSNPVSAGW